MKIAVFSDTHLRDPVSGIVYLRGLLETYAPDAEIVLHAGDLVHPDILLAFDDRILHCVRGNLDPGLADVPVRKVIKVAGHSIGLVHGWGRGAQVEDQALSAFEGEQIDVLVYGHSHLPTCHRRQGILFFNPGSCTERRHAAFHSIGLLEVGTKVVGRIINLDTSAVAWSC